MPINIHVVLKCGRRSNNNPNPNQFKSGFIGSCQRDTRLYARLFHAETPAERSRKWFICFTYRTQNMLRVCIFIIFKILCFLHALLRISLFKNSHKHPTVSKPYMYAILCYQYPRPLASRCLAMHYTKHAHAHCTQHTHLSSSRHARTNAHTHTHMVSLKQIHGTHTQGIMPVQIWEISSRFYNLGDQKLKTDTLWVFVRSRCV